MKSDQFKLRVSECSKVVGQHSFFWDTVHNLGFFSLQKTLSPLWTPDVIIQNGCLKYLIHPQNVWHRRCRTLLSNLINTLEFYERLMLTTVIMIILILQPLKYKLSVNIIVIYNNYFLLNLREFLCPYINC